MACTTPCSACDRKGLPILFTRYAAAYSAEPDSMRALAAMPPSGRFRPHPSHIELKAAAYQVRMLRPGFLYLLITRLDLAPEWSGYAVHPHGYLTEFRVSQPQKAKAMEACTLPLSAANASLVWIPDAKRVSKLHYFFHPDPVDHEHLVKTIQGEPEHFMQSFDVAGWADERTDPCDTGLPAQLTTQVVEFAALGNAALQSAVNEQHFGLMGNTPTERRWGGEPANALVAVERKVRELLNEHPPYAEVHGPRLEKMSQFLAEHKGAIVACDDPMGIAQELSVHLLTASTPYTRWLAAKDANEVDNKWKLAALAAIDSVDKALAHHAITMYDRETGYLADRAQAMDHYPGSDTKTLVRRSKEDGRYEELDLAALQHSRQAPLNAEIEKRQSAREHYVNEGANAEARKKIDRCCDVAALKAFRDAHEAVLARHEALMNSVTEDLLPWLKSDALNFVSLARYNPKAGIETGDGCRCAGQNTTMLLQLDSSEKGRQWYRELDALAPSQKNLVWQMLSLNNDEVSEELRHNLDMVNDSFGPAGFAEDFQDHMKDYRAFSAMKLALDRMKKTLSAVDKMLKEMPTILDSHGSFFARVQSGVSVATSVHDGPLAILMAAVVARFKDLPLNAIEKYIAKAQLISMARGFGEKAAAFAERQAATAFSKKDLKSLRSLSEKIEEGIKNQLPKEAIKDARLPVTLVGINTLALLPLLMNANRKRDPKSISELGGALASLTGQIRMLRANLYEGFFVKPLPDLLRSKKKRIAISTAEEELQAFKYGAAKYVAAGAAVGVVWDLIDSWKRAVQGEVLLATAYTARAAAGIATVAGAFADFSESRLIAWCAKINVWVLLGTATLSLVIEVLNGRAWENWLLAQPFRIKSSRKIPHDCEKQMNDDLVDALGELR